MNWLWASFQWFCDFPFTSMNFPFFHVHFSHDGPAAHLLESTLSRPRIQPLRTSTSTTCTCHQHIWRQAIAIFLYFFGKGKIRGRDDVMGNKHGRTHGEKLKHWKTWRSEWKIWLIMGSERWEYAGLMVGYSTGYSSVPSNMAANYRWMIWRFPFSYGGHIYRINMGCTNNKRNWNDG